MKNSRTKLQSKKDYIPPKLTILAVSGVKIINCGAAFSEANASASAHALVSSSNVQCHYNAGGGMTSSAAAAFKTISISISNMFIGPS